MLLFMTRILACLTLLLTLLSPLTAEAQSSGRGKPIVILNDKGGNVVKTMNHREKLAASGRPVEIRGYCRSACTMYITMPNACLGPKATVGFHAPRIPGTKIIPPVVDQLMARYYRNGILRKWNAEWKHSLKMHKISAREYVRLDPQTRLCRS
ncbi:hypothetical protein RM190_00270 [Paracoccus sp. CPCC 101403]|uniref:Uncharacterized protein n=2 Tax=Paracoccus broussonetiae TaxID=3075834 RepID=A0ABU3E7S6_9RHOB|nr:hypothetical protein [Paracoccus sp. CPCC 101403]MDT1060267.1 hypothetical protein [Paracoccus sp. CPCC 101403]